MNKNQQRKAVALRYDHDKDSAPKVIAKGRGLVAQRIQQIAETTGVPIREDKELADYLMALEMYQEIPVELYGVVAEILAFVYGMDQRYEKGTK